MMIVLITMKTINDFHSEIAKCIEWLLNDNYVTGQIIGINGGWLI